MEQSTKSTTFPGQSRLMLRSPGWHHFRRDLCSYTDGGGGGAGLGSS